MTTEPWFRVHFRKNSILVQGEAELARIRARKVPKVVLVEPAQTYTCAVCETESAWLKSWIWYGSWQDLEEGKPVLYFCGEECQERYSYLPARKRRQKPPRQRKDTRSIAWEPKRFRTGEWRTLDNARREANPRLFPMPEHPKIELGKRESQCRWCGDKITGPYAWQRSWHSAGHGDARDCKHEWLLHTDTDVQYRFLVKRDGLECGYYGKMDGHFESAGTYYFDPVRERGWSAVRWSVKLEVDHIIPLWKVAHLPPEKRRAYFGPENLWLLSKPAHKLKTKLEAAERAATRLLPP